MSFNDEKGNSHSLEYGSQNHKSFKDLPEQEQEKVQRILFITDKFCIGESAYHELTMVRGGEQLPRSYLVKQCKQALNKLCHVSRTPGEAERAQLDIQKELQQQIKEQVYIYTVHNYINYRVVLYNK